MTMTRNRHNRRWRSKLRMTPENKMHHFLQSNNYFNSTKRLWLETCLRQALTCSFCLINRFKDFNKEIRYHAKKLGYTLNQHGLKNNKTGKYISTGSGWTDLLDDHLRLVEAFLPAWPEEATRGSTDLSRDLLALCLWTVFGNSLLLLQVKERWTNTSWFKSKEHSCYFGAHTKPIRGNLFGLIRYFFLL